MKYLRNFFIYIFKPRTIILSSNAKTRYLKLTTAFQFCFLIFTISTSSALYYSYGQYIEEHNLLLLKRENRELKKVNSKLNHRFHKVRNDLDRINTYIEFDKSHSMKKIPSAMNVKDQDSLSAWESSLREAFSSLYGKMDEIYFDSKAKIEYLGLNEKKGQNKDPKEKGITDAILDENAVGGPFEKYQENEMSDTIEISTVTKAKKRDVSNYFSSRMDSILEYEEKLLAVPTDLPSKNKEDLRVTGKFGKRRDPFTNEWAMHGGIDLYVKDKKIRSTTVGVVTKAGVLGAYGKMIEITNKVGKTECVVRFAHLDKILVSIGDVVKIGDVVGIQGSTGRSEAEHLHYEIIVDGQRLNPINFLTFRKAMISSGKVV